MTAYKSEKYIKESLNSIPSNVSVVVGVDGCSLTLDYLLKIKDDYKNLKILWCPNNAGTYITRNTLLINTVSDNIIFLDSDDVYCGSLFKKISENIINYDVIRWSYYILDKNGKTTTPKKNTYYTYANGVFACKRKIFDLLGGYKNWRFSADYDLQVRISKHNINTLKLNENLMYYRQHETSLSKTVPISNRVGVEKKIGGDYVKPIIHDYFEYIK